MREILCISGNQGGVVEQHDEDQRLAQRHADAAREQRRARQGWADFHAAAKWRGPRFPAEPGGNAGAPAAEGLARGMALEEPAKPPPDFLLVMAPQRRVADCLD